MLQLDEITQLNAGTVYGLELRHAMPFEPQGIIGTCDCDGEVTLEDDGLAVCQACGRNWRISVIVRVERA